jgi:hypothetical protein
MKPAATILAIAIIISPTDVYGELISVYQGGVFQGQINAYTGALSGSANYNYFSSAAHPINGPSPSPFEAQMFLYEGSDGLNFNFVLGQEGSGANHAMDLDILVSGSTSDPTVRLFDDPVELTEVGATNLFQGRWATGDNTDGGVIGEIGGDAWTVDVDVVSFSNLDALRVYDSSGSSLNLALDTGASGIITLVPVPEPSALLLCTGVAALSFAVWRKPKSR